MINPVAFKATKKTPPFILQSCPEEGKGVADWAKIEESIGFEAVCDQWSLKCVLKGFCFFCRFSERESNVQQLYCTPTKASHLKRLPLLAQVIEEAVK